MLFQLVKLLDLLETCSSLLFLLINLGLCDINTTSLLLRCFRNTLGRNMKLTIWETWIKFTFRYYKNWLQHLCFSCKFCEILKNAYFVEHLRTGVCELCDFLCRALTYWTSHSEKSTDGLLRNMIWKNWGVLIHWNCCKQWKCYFSFTSVGLIVNLMSNLCLFVLI